MNNQNHSSEKTNGGILRSIRWHMAIASFAIALLTVGIGGWAVFTKISGAVVAPGSIVVESAIKSVQHREGGIVHKILVNDGDAVEAGDPLIVLDDTAARSKHAIIANELQDLNARAARLVAERDGDASIRFPSDAEDNASLEASASDILTSQKLLLHARNGSMKQRKLQLEDQITQLEKQIGGLDAQQQAKQDEIALLDEELAGLNTLLEKQLVTKTRVTTLEREKTRLTGEHGELLQQIAGLREAISERRMQMLQLDADNQTEVLRELQDVRARMAELKEEKVALEDQLDRLEIRAPRAGYIHELAAHTIGGVIRQGETIMQIVPREDLLVVEARVDPADVDQLHRAQEAWIRFPGLDHRTTPQLAAQVARIAADQTWDDVLKTSYYKVRLTIGEEELEKLNGQELIPGMPVEAFMATGSRTVLAYLTKPIVDQITHAWRET
ncbi:HlyD family type I secretion periplasmic adaptor subunit [Hoeflea sp. WL0058]|uniref:Membrane fusion protein (MFP) family protein n=2 Tax=Flavimaribacter sediminis TaxID=2865987 RepID=A0AAE3D1R3_9HYPH|nr:HlyD family type I secretion periplasmic adaptor subunit [Flavimaribacter sediminis]